MQKPLGEEHSLWTEIGLSLELRRLPCDRLGAHDGAISDIGHCDLGRRIVPVLWTGEGNETDLTVMAANQGCETSFQGIVGQQSSWYRHYDS